MGKLLFRFEHAECEVFLGHLDGGDQMARGDLGLELIRGVGCT